MPSTRLSGAREAFIATSGIRGPAPLFVLSFRERDTLAAAAARFGWRPTAARRETDLLARLVESRARVMLVDARGEFDPAMEAIAEVSDHIETSGAALLVLLARGDVHRLDRLFEAGATHYLAAPFGEAEVIQALRFADRYAERLGGGTTSAPRTPRASLDQLTGLDDGHVAARWIEEGLGQDEEGPILILLAASRFDMVNAAFGSATGDSLLRNAARRIERIAAPADVADRLVARIAGAEFLVGLPPGSTPEQATTLAAALVEAVSRPFVAGERVVTLTWHVGLVVAEEGDGDAAALIRRAGAALADAKASDSSAIRLRRSGDDPAEGTGSRRLEVDLRAALDKNEIELLYQPQVSITSGAIVGVEALARWRHPDHGELGAETLFAAAARSDYLIQLSDHVQRKAFEQIAAWPAALGALRVAVNVTAADIVRPGYEQQLFALIDDNKVDRARITVEVTESGLIDDLAVAARLLAALRAGGLKVAIDDFGTGYSSLAYLKALPLDFLKIDKRLSDDITGSERDRIVIRSVIEMARSLDLAVVAEGVETEEQLALLAQEGCNYYQGFLCAPPVDAAELERLLAKAPA